MTVNPSQPSKARCSFASCSRKLWFSARTALASPSICVFCNSLEKSNGWRWKIPWKMLSYGCLTLIYIDVSWYHGKKNVTEIFMMAWYYGFHYMVFHLTKLDLHPAPAPSKKTAQLSEGLVNVLRFHITQILGIFHLGFNISKLGLLLYPLHFGDLFHLQQRRLFKCETNPQNHNVGITMS